MRNWRGALGLLACLTPLSCGDDTGSATMLEGVTACERFTSLAEAKGCRPPTSCNVPEPCDDEAVLWLNCTATNLDQCICEPDGNLNCEGFVEAQRRARSVQRRVRRIQHV